MGGPRPLMNVRCSLIIKDFAGGVSRLAAFTRATGDVFDVKKTDTVEEAGFTDSPRAVLNEDRITLRDFKMFKREYEEQVSSSTELTMETNVNGGSILPRPFADTNKISSRVVVEVMVSDSITDDELVSASDKLVKRSEYFTGYTLSPEKRAVVFNTSSQSIISQQIDAIEEATVEENEEEVSLDDVVITCAVAEH